MTQYNPDNQVHQEVVTKLKQYLEETSKYSIPTPKLAEEIKRKKNLGLKQGTIYSILNSGSNLENGDNFIENSEIQVNRKRGGTSGSPTKMWRLEE